MFRMKLQIVVFLFSFGLLLVSCGNKEWRSIDQNKLMKRCMTEGGSKSYCKCYLKNAMAAYPNAKDMNELDFEESVELSINCE